MPERVEVKAIDAEEIAGVHGIQRESMSHRRRGDQKIHSACSFASSGPSQSRHDVTIRPRRQTVEGHNRQVREHLLQPLHAQGSLAVISRRGNAGFDLGHSQSRDGGFSLLGWRLREVAEMDDD